LKYPLIIALSIPLSVAAAPDSAELAKKLSNPIAAMISIPLQLNADQDIGPQEHGETYKLNIQPVVPMTLNSNWNIISRTILPLVHQSDVRPGAGSQTGLGDIVQSLFFSPVAPTKRGWIWGAGPVFLLPTATENLLGADQWGVGPTVVMLRQQGLWTYGMLANHIWGVAGSDRLEEISSTFIQPFLAYNTPTAWTFGLNSESTYDWNAEQWSAPINVTVAKIHKVGRLPVQFGAGLRWWADSPENQGPEGLGFRLNMTVLLPR
jgi:hypothetical protein